MDHAGEADHGEGVEEIGAEHVAEGELRAGYMFSSGDWQLQQVTSLSLVRMEPGYAVRLGELTGFPLHFAASIGDLAQVEAELQ